MFSSIRVHAPLKQIYLSLHMQFRYNTYRPVSSLKYNVFVMQCSKEFYEWELYQTLGGHLDNYKIMNCAMKHTGGERNGIICPDTEWEG